jgi:hypothetical protein
MNVIFIEPKSVEELKLELKVILCRTKIKF